MILDPTITYLEWNGTEFPNSSYAEFKAPADSTIDWGDGTSDIFDTASTTITTHKYTDGIAKHTITISRLTSIDNAAFRNCEGLTSIIIGNSITIIGSSAFRNCTSLTSVTIPNSVISIGNDAFAHCRSLTSVTIPNSVTSIGSYAFAHCRSLKSVTIPNSVTSITSYAFYECTSLTSITIPDSVTSIGNDAFAYCSSLQTIILFRETPPTLGSSAIPSTTTIYVSQSSKATYKTAQDWSAFASKIEANDIYLSLVRFNKRNKEYIDKVIADAIKSATISN